MVTRTVTRAYFRALQIPILKGPGFTEEERDVEGPIHDSQQGACGVPVS